MFRLAFSPLITASIFVCLAISPASAAVIFQNGFEAPVVNHPGPTGDTGGYDNYGTGQSIGPWTVVGPPGANDAVSVVTDNFTQNGFSFHAQSGAQWADLAGQNANGTEGVETTLSGLNGKSYTVSFWVGNVVDPRGVFGNSTTVNLYVNNSLVYTALNNAGAGQTSQFWQQFSYTGIGTNGPMTFKFLSGDPGDDFSSAFDSVTITTADVSTVPGPIAGAGFPGLLMALMGLIAWRRRAIFA